MIASSVRRVVTISASLTLWIATSFTCSAKDTSLAFNRRPRGGLAEIQRRAAGNRSHPRLSQSANRRQGLFAGPQRDEARRLHRHPRDSQSGYLQVGNHGSDRGSYQGAPRRQRSGGRGVSTAHGRCGARDAEGRSGAWLHRAAHPACEHQFVPSASCPRAQIGGLSVGQRSGHRRGLRANRSPNITINRAVCRRRSETND